MSAQVDHKKWCICQVHQSGFPDPPYYTSLPQYGPWDNERDARQVSNLLARLENPAFGLAVRECVDGPVVASVSQIDFDHGDRRNFIARPARHKEEIL